MNALSDGKSELESAVIWLMTKTHVCCRCFTYSEFGCALHDEAIHKQWMTDCWEVLIGHLKINKLSAFPPFAPSSMNHFTETTRSNSIAQFVIEFQTSDLFVKARFSFAHPLFLMSDKLFCREGKGIRGRGKIHLKNIWRVNIRFVGKWRSRRNQFTLEQRISRVRTKHSSDSTIHFRTAAIAMSDDKWMKISIVFQWNISATNRQTYPKKHEKNNLPILMSIRLLESIFLHVAMYERELMRQYSCPDAIESIKYAFIENERNEINDIF